mgnify:CR=1 FL=1
MHVTRKLKPRYFVQHLSKSFGIREKAYKVTAKREVASEFDHLGWVVGQSTGPFDDISSPALRAFRKRWCRLWDEGEEYWYPTDAYRQRVVEVMNRMMREDGVPHYEPELGGLWKPSKDTGTQPV